MQEGRTPPPDTRANLALDAFADASRELADTGPMTEATDRQQPDSAARLSRWAARNRFGS